MVIYCQRCGYDARHITGLLDHWRRAHNRVYGRAVTRPARHHISRTIVLTEQGLAILRGLSG